MRPGHADGAGWTGRVGGCGRFVRIAIGVCGEAVARGEGLVSVLPCTVCGGARWERQGMLTAARAAPARSV